MPHPVQPCAAHCPRQLLVKDVGARLALDDVPHHPWVRANADPSVLQ